jgi:hypothetical protein
MLCTASSNQDRIEVGYNPNAVAGRTMDICNLVSEKK